MKTTEEVITEFREEFPTYLGTGKITIPEGYICNDIKSVEQFIREALERSYL